MTLVFSWRKGQEASHYNDVSFATSVPSTATFLLRRVRHRYCISNPGVCSRIANILHSPQHPPGMRSREEALLALITHAHIKHCTKQGVDEQGRIEDGGCPTRHAYPNPIMVHP